MPRDVRRLLAARLPAMADAPVVPLGEGTDHAAYLAGGTLVVRLSGDGTDVEREARLLAAVSQLVSLPVPEVVFTSPADGSLAYHRLPGVPLLELPPGDRSAHAPALAAELGRLLCDLHTASPPAPVEPDDTPPSAWLAEAAEHYAAVADAVPPQYQPAIEAFLADPPPAAPERLAFSHNDLGIEHVLVDPSGPRITGIIDWTDAALVDPATDFGRLLRDLGPPALDAALTTYATPPIETTTLRARARFYARCGLLEDLAFGLAHDRPPYIAKSLTALPWLFP